MGPRAGLEFVEREKLLAVTGIRTADGSVRTLVTVSAAMSEREELIAES